MTDQEKLKAAYALNLFSVSISQIIEYNDYNVMLQEYHNIIDNLDMREMPKDDSLKVLIDKIMHEITASLKQAGDLKFVEREYQHRVRNAIWSAVPNVPAIFSTSGKGFALALATQIGIGCMNYRRNIAEYRRGYEKEKWEIVSHRLDHLNGLLTKLFDATWELEKHYDFPTSYYLSLEQIKDYNKALMVPDPLVRYNYLESMQENFEAYPVFWYQLGSSANSIYRAKDKYDLSMRDKYKDRAIAAFQRYEKLNSSLHLLRHDTITSAWALEYLELLGLNGAKNESAKYLIKKAEDNAGGALDILELCAFSYLQIEDLENATRLFKYMVYNEYNAAINTQILSGLYIIAMRGSDGAKSAEARQNYRELGYIHDHSLQNYILPIPDSSMRLSNWKVEWNREVYVPLIERRAKDKRKDEEAKNEAKRFFNKNICLVYGSGNGKVAEYFLGILNDIKKELVLDSKQTGQTNAMQICTMELKEYKKQRADLEGYGFHVILLGDSDEAKKVYGAKQHKWDYKEYEMRYVSYGNKTVILLRQLKINEIDGLLALARDMNKKYPIEVPSDDGGINVFKEFYDDVLNAPRNVVEKIIDTIVASPLLIFEGAYEVVENGKKMAVKVSPKHWDFLRYSILIYKYLASEKALYHVNKGLQASEKVSASEWHTTTSAII